MTYAESLRKEGKLVAQKEIARELLKSGVDNSVIAMATHLSLDEIKRLEKSLH